MDEGDNLLLMESYIMPDFRDKNLLYDEILSQKNIMIHNPRTEILKTLINGNLAKELSDGINVSKILFNISSFDLKIKVDGMGDYHTHIYDLNHKTALLLEDKSTFNYSTSSTDHLDRDYLNKAQQIVADYDEKYLKVNKKEVKLNIIFV